MEKDNKIKDRDSQPITIRYPNLLGRMFGKGNRYMGSARGAPLWLLHKLSPLKEHYDRGTVSSRYSKINTEGYIM